MNNFARKPRLEPTIENLSKALYSVNRHAKTALEPKFLYDLKKRTLKKMIDQGIAKKVGLHFSRNPRFCKQRSDVLVQCGDYTFHMPPTKEDFKILPHLGELDDQVRNPKAHMSLKQAKLLLMSYTGVKEANIEQKSTYLHSNPYQPLFLGKKSWAYA